jgi:ribosomal protein S18 acetylase RimI-like enzyme
MDAITYVTLVPEDLPLFQHLMYDYLIEFDPRGMYADDEYYAALRRGLAAGTHTIWLARTARAAVGFALVRIEQQWYRESAKVGVVEEFYVAPACRHQGVGRALAARAVASLRSQGATAISASVVQANMGGLLFWQRLGFTIEAYHLFLRNQ